MTFFFLIEIPLFCLALMIWITCCYYAQQRRESEEEALVCGESPSVYVIPLRDEGQEDTCDPCSGQSYRESRLCCPSGLGLPPPYRLEPPSYIDAAPPSYSDLFLHSTGRTVP